MSGSSGAVITRAAAACLAIACAVAICALSLARSSIPAALTANAEPTTAWHLGEPGASCSDTCDQFGGWCDETALVGAHSAAAVLAAASEAGTSCTRTVGWGYPFTPGVCTSAGCCGGECVGVCAFGESDPQGSCGARDVDYSRLCPCYRLGKSPAPPPPLTTVQPPPPPPLAPAWHLGKPGASCSDTCDQFGGWCDETALVGAHSAAAVLAAASEAGTSCTRTVGWGYPFTPAVCTSAGCCGGECVGVCAFGESDPQGSCGARAVDYSRLCPCSGRGSPVPPSAPPAPPVPPAPPSLVYAHSFYWGAAERASASTEGFSWYTRIFALWDEGVPLRMQMGMGSTWLTPTNVEFGETCACDPAGWPSTTVGDGRFGCCDSAYKCRDLYETVEGGPGYWMSQLPTTRPKWRHGMTAGCYSEMDPSLFAFGVPSPKPCSEHAIVQLSNRLLLAPDGVTFSREGLLGVGYARTPLGQTSAEDGRNFVTIVLDAGNFGGPLAYVLPEFWARRPDGYAAESAHLADFGSAGVGFNWGGAAFEWNTISTLKGAGGMYRIPRLRLPRQSGRTVLVRGQRGYAKDSVHGAIRAALERGVLGRAPFAAGSSTRTQCYEATHAAAYKLEGEIAVQPGSVGTLRTTVEEGECVWAHHPPSSAAAGQEEPPRFFAGPERAPAPESAAGAALRDAAFPEKPPWGPYDALRTAPEGGCLDAPGPARPELHCVRTTSPSWIAYRWYRFVDQPALQRLRLSAEQREFMQARAEALHRLCAAGERWIEPGGAEGEELAEIDGAQLVKPPPGLELGFVPVPLYEGIEKPAGCDTAA